MNKKIKEIAYILITVLVCLFMPIIISDGGKIKAYAATKETKWDDTWHISKDGLYSYYKSLDGKEAKIFYYQGPWNVKN